MADSNNGQLVYPTGLSRIPARGQSGIPAPPIVDQPHGASGETATRQIAGAVPAPAPLILQLVKTVLRIRPVPVQLRDAQNTFCEIRHQHGVFVDFGLAPVHESKFQLALLFLGGNQVLLQQTPENNHPMALLPPGKLNAVLAVFPALSGVHPVAEDKFPLQQAFDAI